MERERDLVVCCDGTWNGPDVELVTNVRRLFNALEQDENQLCYYQTGVGTSANPLDWFFGGATGRGIRRDIIHGYAWLAQHYQPGDRIWLFGFSRGAFTARSIAGMIGHCGILDGRVYDAERTRGTFYRRVEKCFEQYRERGARDLCSYGPVEYAHEDFPVYFIGVWDTVGALGIPAHLGMLKLFDPPHKHQFHDVRLHPGVRYARHCLAMDELRAPFTPTLWEGENSERMKQVWFPGSHVDVGGGYGQDGLSAVALSWMIDEAREVGLRLKQGQVEAIRARARPLDTMHDDMRVALQAVGPLYMLLKPVLDYVFSPRPRSTPAIEPNNRQSASNRLASVHASAFERQQAVFPNAGPAYPHASLEPGSSRTVSVLAQTDWNRTGLYLAPGTYSFTARGVWRDPRGHWCGPEGESWGVLKHGLFSAVGALERGFNLLGSRVPVEWRARMPWLLRVMLETGQGGMGEAPWTRRAENMPWMSLVGVVANGQIRGRDYVDNQTFLIGNGHNRELVVDKPGYLYAFANHAWRAYQDNWGEVQLTVRCESLVSRPRRPEERQPAPEEAPRERHTVNA